MTNSHLTFGILPSVAASCRTRSARYVSGAR